MKTSEIGENYAPAKKSRSGGGGGGGGLKTPSRSLLYERRPSVRPLYNITRPSKSAVSFSRQL